LLALTFRHGCLAVFSSMMASHDVPNVLPFMWPGIVRMTGAYTRLA